MGLTFYLAGLCFVSVICRTIYMNRDTITDICVTSYCGDDVLFVSEPIGLRPAAAFGYSPVRTSFISLTSIACYFHDKFSACVGAYQCKNKGISLLLTLLQRSIRWIRRIDGTTPPSLCLLILRLPSLSPMPPLSLSAVSHHVDRFFPRSLVPV
jgi:hypothetical protein